jgi:hypothetical protein
VRLFNNVYGEPEQLGEALPKVLGSPKASKPTWPGDEFDRDVNVGRISIGRIARSRAEQREPPHPQPPQLRLVCSQDGKSCVAVHDQKICTKLLGIKFGSLDRGPYNIHLARRSDEGLGISYSNALDCGDVAKVAATG